MNIINAAFVRNGVTVRTLPVYQYDSGMILQISGLDDLPSTFRADFSNAETGQSKSVIGTDGEVHIPYEYFVPGATIHCWLVWSGEDYTVTRKHIMIPIARRATPTDEEPSPDEQGVIDQAIAKLNDAVAQTGQDVEAAAGYAERAEQSAQAAIDAQDAAVAAQNAAEAARDKSVQSASNASVSAQSAQTSADAAQAGAQSAQAAADQAAQSAEDAAAALPQVETAGAAQVNAIQTAGQQQTQAVTAAGAQQVSAVQTEGADQRAAVETAGAAQAAAIQAEGQAQQTAIQQKGADTLASIPADYTELSGDVAELKSALNTVNDGYYSFGLVPNKYILRDNGAEANYNGWSATDFIEVPPNSLMLYYGTQNLVWGAKYDAEKTYVEPATWNTQFNSFFNDTGDTIFFRTSGSNADMASVKFRIFPIVDTTLTKQGYPADAKAVGDRISAISQNSDVIPSYYETHLAAKETIIRGHFDDCAYNGDGLVFLTDTHFSTDLFTSNAPSTAINANHSFALIADIFKKCAIDKIAFGGDLVNSAPDIDTMLLCIASFGARFGNRQNRLRYCVGNHEYYTGNDMGATTKPTPSMLYGAGVKYNEDIVLGKGDMVTYYFDNALQKIRYFVVSCGRDTELTIPQVEWVLSEFKNIPSGYHVVLIGHGFMTDAMTGFRGRYLQIANAFDKVKSKSSISYNGTLYDYSALDNVTPVCIITGHVHIDGSITTTGGIPCISTTTDSYAQNYELVDGTPTSSPRTKGTTDEQAFDIYQFDFTNRKIYVTRIGYGSDREFSY